ncbi:hypothetical protein [Massilia antarctica]|uniref:hypothetical protein n=1 Tax=Massilia antarctica TaxID=2765360 RepID=UPI001E451C1C|nr:hypothetical protein [Massilia antarctica]
MLHGGPDPLVKEGGDGIHPRLRHAPERLAKHAGGRGNGVAVAAVIQAGGQQGIDVVAFRQAAHHIHQSIVGACTHRGTGLVMRLDRKVMMVSSVNECAAVSSGSVRDSVRDFSKWEP